MWAKIKYYFLLAFAGLLALLGVWTGYRFGKSKNNNTKLDSVERKLNESLEEQGIAIDRAVSRSGEITSGIERANEIANRIAERIAIDEARKYETDRILADAERAISEARKYLDESKR